MAGGFAAGLADFVSRERGACLADQGPLQPMIWSIVYEVYGATSIATL
jgi:hypothetical protein